MDPDMRLDTKVVHGPRHEHDPQTGSHRIPIYQTSSFVFKSADHGARIFSGEEKGYVYTRLGNPTIDYLEEKVAFLEGAEAGAATASGMAAVSAVVFTTCDSGDKVIVSDPVYGGTFAFFELARRKFNIDVVYIPAVKFHELLENHIDEKTKLVYIETPANPTLDIVDIEKTAEITKKYGIPLAVDNTFATPITQRPIELGADIVLHSMTKYLSGHGDTIGGIVVGKKDFIHTLKHDIVSHIGANYCPFNAYFILRGIKTLAVRVRKHSENAMKVAEFLNGHPMVERVLYPGLPDHPLHEVAKKQMNGMYSGVLSFIVKGGKEAGKKLIERVKIPALAVSLGDTDSYIEHPASMTHSTYSDEELAKAGIHQGLVRLSVGIEDPDDLIEDLDKALNSLKI